MPLAAMIRSGGAISQKRLARKVAISVNAAAPSSRAMVLRQAVPERQPEMLHLRDRTREADQFVETALQICGTLPQKRNPSDNRSAEPRGGQEQEAWLRSCWMKASSSLHHTAQQAQPRTPQKDFSSDVGRLAAQAVA